MTVILIIAAIIFIGLLLYAMLVREWLKKQLWARAFFAWGEPFEIAMFKKSETILAGQLVWLGGALVSGYDAIAVFATGLDLTPITTRVFDFARIPEDMRGLAGTIVFMLIGRMMIRLRKRTTKPIEVVAIAAKDVTPQVAAALASADIAKDNAVAAVNEAKAA
jgi:hypothetical protein